MPEFDFETAWRELARPAYDCLPANVRDLYEHVAKYGREWRQDSTLDVLFPDREAEGGEYYGLPLRCAFENLDPYYVAVAARAIYCCGHWKPGREKFPGSEHGAHWKFASLADQVLRLALAKLSGPPDLPPEKRPIALRSPRHGSGYGFEVHEGFLRAFANNATRRGGSEFWTWEEIGLATPNVLERARRVPTPVLGWKEAERYFVELREVCLPMAGFAAAFFDTESYMVPDGTWAARRDAERKAARERRDEENLALFGRTTLEGGY